MFFYLKLLHCSAYYDNIIMIIHIFFLGEASEYMYKKTISKSLGLLITLLITIAIVIISYASYITYAANQRTISTLSEISHQNQIIFSLEIERDAKIIENAASYIEKLGYASFDDILTFLKHSQIANQQHLLGIVTPDGKLTDINGVEIDLSQYPNTKESFNC